MTQEIKRRRGTTAQHATFTGANAETTVDTDKKTVVVHDGATAGGFPLARADNVATALANKLDKDGGNVGDATAQGTFREAIGLYPQGFELIADDAVSSAASWQALNLGAYVALRLSYWFVPATNGGSLEMRFSTDNGGTWISGSGDYSDAFLLVSVNPLLAGLQDISTVGLAGATASFAGGAGEISLQQFNKSQSCYYTGVHAWRDSSADQNQINRSGYNYGTTARNAIQVFSSTGNIASGRFILEGLRG